MVGPEGRLDVKSRECLRCNLSSLKNLLLLTTRHPLIHVRAGVDGKCRKFLAKRSAEGCILDMTSISANLLPFPYPN